ncbi:MAG TPA: CaiB/BaiF CoA-transferase family protein [Xanthobacteraceae bacterium]|nr:CaiB/BaiF CoA-transferase family protein [Xanthobacteraceae bacterium]
MTLPLSGLLVIGLEQAVAAPTASCRLADAGARVIKIERPEGDFARLYDKTAKAREDGRNRPDVGECSYFVWLNRGKESVILDLTRADDKALLAAMLARADVFVQNLKPGAIAKLGFAIDRLRHAHPRLIICSISGYGEEGPYAERKAYDMLIQAESGLASITGGPEAPARVGVSVCDIAAGMNAYEAILEALIQRGRTGEGCAISISMFDAMADWMATPLIQYEGGMPPKRIGLAHTSIAPYGVFKTREGADILISIQSDREWRALAAQVLGDKALAADPAFATNVERVKRRAETDGKVQAVFGATDEATLTQKLAAADIAFARVNDTALLAAHPHLRRIEVATPSGTVSYPAPAARCDGEPRRYGAVPALGEHSERIRAEFLPRA